MIQQASQDEPFTTFQTTLSLCSSPKHHCSNVASARRRHYRRRRCARSISTADVVALLGLISPSAALCVSTANVSALLSLVSPGGDGKIRAILNEIRPRTGSARRRRRSGTCSRWRIWSGSWGRWGVDPVQLHSYVVKAGLSDRVTVSYSLLTMYSKSNCISEAYKVFTETPEKDVILCTSMIAAFSEHGFVEYAFLLFRRLVFEENLAFDQRTLVAVLHTCSTCQSLKRGKEVHGHIIRIGLEKDISIGGALVNMYSKCRLLDSAIEDAGFEAALINEVTHQGAILKCRIQICKLQLLSCYPISRMMLCTSCSSDFNIFLIDYKQLAPQLPRLAGVGRSFKCLN